FFYRVLLPACQFRFSESLDSKRSGWQGGHHHNHHHQHCHLYASDVLPGDFCCQPAAGLPLELPTLTLSSADSKCFIEIRSFSLLSVLFLMTCSLMAVIAAAFTIAAISAPVIPSVISTSLSRLTSESSGFLL